MVGSEGVAADVGAPSSEARCEAQGTLALFPVVVYGEGSSVFLYECRHFAQRLDLLLFNAWGFGVIHGEPVTLFRPHTSHPPRAQSTRYGISECSFS